MLNVLERWYERNNYFCNSKMVRYYVLNIFSVFGCQNYIFKYMSTAKNFWVIILKYSSYFVTKKALISERLDRNRRKIFPLIIFNSYFPLTRRVVSGATPRCRPSLILFPASGTQRILISSFDAPLY